jgi:hypothetical protein
MRTRLLLVLALMLAAGCASSPDAAPPGPEAAAPADLPWRWAPSQPTLNEPLAESAAAWSGPQVHLIGGFTATGGGTVQVQLVDLGTGFAATNIEPYPLPVHHVQAAQVGDVLFAFGGYIGGVPVPGTPATEPGWPRTALAFKNDLNERRWVPISGLPEPRAAGAAAVLDGQVYLVGGTSPSGFHTAVLRYDPATDAYAELAPLPVPRDHLNLLAVDGALYAIAGRVLADGQGYDDLETFERYDVANDTWTTLPPVPFGRGGQAAALVAGHIVVAGGEVADGPFDVFDAVHAYDLANGTWRELPPMPEARHGGALVPYGEDSDEAFYLGGARLDGSLAASSLHLRIDRPEPSEE